jgi:hypothetical protein
MKSLIKKLMRSSTEREDWTEKFSKTLKSIKP